MDACENVLQRILYSSSSTITTTTKHTTSSTNNACSSVDNAAPIVAVFDKSNLPCLRFQRNVVKLMLACELLFGKRNSNDDDDDSSDDDETTVVNEACLLLHEIVVGRDRGNKTVAQESMENIVTENNNSNAPCAFACELLAYAVINSKPPLSVDVRNRSLRYATVAASSGFDTPLSHFLLFVKCLFNDLKRDLPPLEEFLSQSFNGCVEYFSVVTNDNDKPIWMKHLKQSAFGGLVEAQQLLAFALSLQDDQKLSLFIRRSLPSIQKQQLYIIESNLDSDDDENSLCIVDIRWLEWLQQQTREPILYRMQQYCNNCLSIQYDDDDAPRKVCSRCKLVRYCSAECQRKHWFDVHKRWCQQSIGSEQYPTTIMTLPDVMVDHLNSLISKM